MARELLQLAITNAASNLPLARKQAALARRLLLRFNIRLEWRLKKYFCRGCKQLIVPGLNSRVRLGHGRTLVRITCNDCGFVNRRFAPKARLNIQK